MKLITKPVKKVTTEELNNRSRKATAAAAAMLSGLIAITASGCSADIKLADGTPVGSVVINNEALSSNVSVNQQGANADVITDPSIVLPEDNFDKETDPEKTDDTDPAETENTEPEVVETTAAPTATPAPATATPTPKAAEPTKVPATPTAAPTAVPTEAPDDFMGSFSIIPDHTVYNFNIDDNKVYYIEGEFGDIDVKVEKDNKVRFRFFGQEFYEAAPCSELASIYLLKDYGKTMIYIQFVSDEGPAIYAYALTDKSVKLAGVVKNVYFEGKVANTRYFWVIETYGKSAYAEVRRNYEFSYVSGLPVVDEDMITTFYTHGKELKAARDMKGCVVRDGRVYKDEIVVIKAGNTATPYQTDGHWYVDVKTEGTIVRVDFTTEYVKYHVSDDSRWLYRAVDTMFDFA